MVWGGAVSLWGSPIGWGETGWCPSAGFRDAEGPWAEEDGGLWKLDEGRKHYPWSIRRNQSC